MANSETGTREVEDRLISAIQQYPQSPPTAIDALEPVARSGDRRARALRAWMLAQQGRISEAAPEVLGLLQDAGRASYLPTYVGQQLVTQADPTLRDQGARMLQYAIDEPSALDPFQHVQQLVQLGDRDRALDLLASAVVAPPAAERDAWRDLVARSRTDADAISATAASVATDRDRALAAIGEAREAVERGREDITRLVEEVGGLAGVASASVQADDYGRRADVIERRANVLIMSAIILGLAIAGTAVYLAIEAAQAKDSLQAALEKLPISIPFLLLNLYVGRLGSQFREEAIRLRHIELQIRSANPFLGALDEDRRKAVLAMLALRFFPGQSLPVPTDTSEPPDIAQSLGTLLAGTPPQRSRSGPLRPEEPAAAAEPSPSAPGQA